MSGLELALHRAAVAIFTFWMVWDAYVIFVQAVNAYTRRLRRQGRL